MKRRYFIIINVIILAAMLTACGSPEEKKMKFFNKGNTLFEKGDVVKARLEFKNSIQIDPKFANAYYMLGMCELKQGHFKQAYAGFSKAVKLSPDHLITGSFKRSAPTGQTVSHGKRTGQSHGKGTFGPG